MKKLLALIVLGGVIFPALAAPPPYYIAGDFNGWNAAGNLMTETAAGSGIYQAALTGLTPGRHEFKITQGDWDWNYPGPNSWLFTDANGNITISYDVNTYSDGWSSPSQRIGLSVDPGSWTAAGDFQGWNNAEGNMVSIGGGIHRYQLATPGTWKWKAVLTGSWDSISWDNRSVGTTDWEFTLGAGQFANLYVDAFTGIAKVEIVPEPTALALLGLGGLLFLRRRKE